MFTDAEEWRRGRTAGNHAGTSPAPLKLEHNADSHAADPASGVHATRVPVAARSSLDASRRFGCSEKMASCKTFHLMALRLSVDSFVAFLLTVRARVAALLADIDF